MHTAANSGVRETRRMVEFIKNRLRGAALGKTRVHRAYRYGGGGNAVERGCFAFASAGFACRTAGWHLELYVLRQHPQGRQHFRPLGRESERHLHVRSRDEL